MKTWECDKKAPQNFGLERETIAERQGSSEDQSSEEKPTLSKTNFSFCLSIDGLKIHEENGKFKTFVKATVGTVSYTLFALIGLIEIFCRSVFLMLAKALHFLIPAKYSEKFDTYCFYPLRDHVKFTSQATGDAVQSLWAYFQDLHITGYRVEEKKVEPPQKGDDFLEAIFSLDPKEYEKMQALLKRLGTSNTPEQQKKALLDMEKVSIHPLVFLYCLFQNKESTSYVANFETNSDNYQWDAFFTLQEKNFDNTKKEDLEKTLPGFCQCFSLDEEEVRGFIEKRNWEALIFSVCQKQTNFFHV